jgi:thiamine-phosphate pyrophosphorylase
MKFCSEQLLLYAITDRRWSTRQKFLDKVEKSLIDGATYLQLREKNLDHDSFFEEAIKFYHYTKSKRAFYNNVDKAIEVDEEGVQIRQDDMSLHDVRKKLREGKIF